METGRRIFLSALAATLAGAEALIARGQGQRRENPHIPQIPDASDSTAGDDAPLPARADPKEQLKEDQKAIRRDVDRLLQMVKDLKDETDKTPETDILSLTMVKKVEDIEKLARQIRDRIRAS